MSNKEYIEKYKDEDEVIKTWFQVRDRSGNTVDVTGIVNPLKVDNRQLASVTDQQGSTPHCAGYSIANLAEAVIWKRTGRLVNLNADQIYAKAKTMDGDADSEGTYLEYAIKAALDLGGIANPEKVKTGFLYNDRTDSTVEALKYLVHKYDFVHAGFSITTGWYSCNQSDPVIKHTSIPCGGHAVLVVGYDQDGAYIQNSWGPEWGSKGFGVLPWAAFKQEAMYFCYLQNVYDGLNEG